MGWKGIAFGAWIGSKFGGSLGTLLGAALGHQIEKQFTKPDADREHRTVDHSDSRSARERSMAFCASATAMLAKFAKMDGCVSQNEIRAVETAFEKLGFNAHSREYAIDVFSRAKEDPHTIFDYAVEFTAAMTSVEVRELFYSLLWDLACVDGVVAEPELSVLRGLTAALKIRTVWFQYYAQKHCGGNTEQCDADGKIDDAYVTLGISKLATLAEAQNAYRQLAKKYHPDLLRAQGLPDEMLRQATERMERINESWQTIQKGKKDQV